MQSVNDINTKLAAGLKSEMQRNAMLTRESRRIIDNEESNVELLIRAYLLTQDTQYSKEAIKRILEMVSWDENENVKGCLLYTSPFVCSKRIPPSHNSRPSTS